MEFLLSSFKSVGLNIGCGVNLNLPSYRRIIWNPLINDDSADNLTPGCKNCNFILADAIGIISDIFL